MKVGRVFLSTQTTASVIESTAKDATGPEEAFETTISAEDNTGNFSEQSPVDKLFLVERGGFGIMYNQNKNQQRARERPSNASQQRARKPRSTTGEILLVVFVLSLLWVVLPQLGTATLGPPKTTLSDQRAPIGSTTSE